MNLIVRDANPADCRQIADYNCRLAAESEGLTLDTETIRKGVQSLLNDSSKGRYWLAVDADRIVGQIMVTYEWSDWRNGVLWWVQSVYVHADYRRKGVFTTLYRHVESIAREEPEVAGIRLYVEHENTRAQETYRTLGMSMTTYQVMQSIF
ncbi:MAG: GNAT family N-acetyltransferase [Woeseiaceae bacterium]|nr:GNAT family N-acetyltransferase [Woeseiaceae bacterium]